MTLPSSFSIATTPTSRPAPRPSRTARTHSPSFSAEVVAADAALEGARFEVDEALVGGLEVLVLPAMLLRVEMRAGEWSEGKRVEQRVGPLSSVCFGVVVILTVGMGSLILTMLTPVSQLKKRSPRRSEASPSSQFAPPRRSDTSDTLLTLRQSTHAVLNLSPTSD